MDLTKDEAPEDETRRVAKDWYSSGFGWSTNPMEKLAMIPEVTNTGEETAPSVIAPMIRVFALPGNLPEIKPHGTPSVIAPSLSVPQSRPMVMPIVPISMQSRMGNTTLKEYVE